MFGHVQHPVGGEGVVVGLGVGPAVVGHHLPRLAQPDRPVQLDSPRGQLADRRQIVGVDGIGGQYVRLFDIEQGGRQVDPLPGAGQADLIALALFRGEAGPGPPRARVQHEGPAIAGVGGQAVGQAITGGEPVIERAVLGLAHGAGAVVADGLAVVVPAKARDQAEAVVHLPQVLGVQGDDVPRLQIVGEGQGRRRDDRPIDGVEDRDRIGIGRRRIDAQPFLAIGQPIGLHAEAQGVDAQAGLDLPVQLQPRRQVLDREVPAPALAPPAATP